MVIRGHRFEEDYASEPRTGIHQLEIFYGDFFKQVTLPDVGIDVSNIRASAKDGVMCVLIPKTQRIVITRTIHIKKS